ncbi:unnamed protein product [Phaeothamnion confervicola]
MDLRPYDYATTRAEVARRRQQLDVLRAEVAALDAAGGYSGAGSGPSGGGRLAHQREAMRENDAAIDELARGVSRLHQQSRQIHGETTLHTRLLDEMEPAMDATEKGLGAERLHAARIKDRGSNTRLYLVILVLVIVLILLIVLGFS